MKDFNRHLIIHEKLLDVVDLEQKITAERFGPTFNSDQNCYATIYDEIMEAKESMDNILEDFVDKNISPADIGAFDMNILKKESLNLALEAIQIYSACVTKERTYRK